MWRMLAQNALGLALLTWILPHTLHPKPINLKLVSASFDFLPEPAVWFVTPQQKNMAIFFFLEWGLTSRQVQQASAQQKAALESQAGRDSNLKTVCVICLVFFRHSVLTPSTFMALLPVNVYSFHRLPSVLLRWQKSPRSEVWLEVSSRSKTLKAESLLFMCRCWNCGKDLRICVPNSTWWGGDSWLNRSETSESLWFLSQFFLMLPCAPKFAGHAAHDGVSAKAARSLDRLRLNRHIVDCLHIAFAWNI